MGQYRRKRPLLELVFQWWNVLSSIVKVHGASCFWAAFGEVMWAANSGVLSTDGNKVGKGRM